MSAGGGRWFRFGSRRDIDSELSDEIAFHIERTIADLRSRGWSLPDAEREAYRRFGDVDRYRRNLRHLDEGRWTMSERRERFGNLLRDLAYALRSLRREPALAIGITLTLALGIGANATMFGIVDRLLLTAPEHVREPESLRRMLLQQEFLGRTFVQTSLEYADWVELSELDLFRSVAGWYRGELTYGYGATAERVSAGAVTASFFPTLGVEPERGRFFGLDDDVAGADSVAVVGYEFWRSRLGSDEEILGRELVIAERPYRVVGVTPPGFTGLELSRVDVWLPLHVAGDQIFPGMDFAPSRESGMRFFWLKVVGRLAAAASPEVLDTRVNAIHQAAFADDEDYSGVMLTAPLIAARGPDPSAESRVSLWLTGVAAAVLLVACANVANMLLARGMRRRGEIAVRMALGVPRGRLIRQLLAESLLLAGAGSVAALLLAQWGGGAVRALLLPDVVWTRGVLDPRMLTVTASLAFLTGFAAGLLPALQWSRHDVMEALKGGGRNVSGRSRTRTALLVVQAALSVVLLTGAGLFVRSLHEAGRVDFGFDDPAATLVATPERSYASLQDESFRWPEEDMLQRLRRHPSVEGATAAITTPFGMSWSVSFSLPGRDDDELPRLPTGGPYIHPVASDYFRTLGLRILAGRGLEETDREESTLVTVVSETMASRFWPEESAIGQCVLVGSGAGDSPPPCTTVVGVVEDARRNRIEEAETFQYYVPLGQRRINDSISFLVRISPEADANGMSRELQREIQAFDPNTIRYVEAFPLQSRIDPQARAWQLGASLFSAFGLLAAVVAAVGLYGVLAFDVAQRTREMGVRAALGASAGRLRLLVLRQGLSVTAVGVLTGLLLALAGAGRLEELLFRVPARDPLTALVVGLTLLGVAAVASWMPARRATRVDPNTALRVD